MILHSLWIKQVLQKKSTLLVYLFCMIDSTMLILHLVEISIRMLSYQTEQRPIFELSSALKFW